MPENDTQNTPPTGNNLPVIIGVLVVIAAIAVFVMMRGETPNQEQVSQSEIKTFNVSGKPVSFTPSEIRVKQGDRVRIVFYNEMGTHDWVIDEFNARTPMINAGQTAEVEFVADKTGQFEYYCSVPGHRAAGMKGTLVVE